MFVCGLMEQQQVFVFMTLKDDISFYLLDEVSSPLLQAEDDDDEGVPTPGPPRLRRGGVALLTQQGGLRCGAALRDHRSVRDHLG